METCLIAIFMYCELDYVKVNISTYVYIKVKVKLSIDSEVLKKAKELAVERKVTLSEIFEKAVSELGNLSTVNKIMRELDLSPRLISFEEVTKSRITLNASDLVGEMRDELFRY
ncbi:hypothetical protein [Sulfolobus acidocaldarius]|nr:hypothetical protein [Sulfolobus acidocaldarius]